MKAEKLDSIRRVDEYVEMKRRQRVLSAFKSELDFKQQKEANDRKACKFRLFRYTHYLKLAAFNALKQTERLMKTAEIPSGSPTRKTFNKIKRHKSQKTLRQRYWALWKKQLRNKPTTYRSKVQKQLLLPPEPIKDELMSGMICLRMSQERDKNVRSEFNKVVQEPRINLLRC